MSSRVCLLGLVSKKRLAKTAVGTMEQYSTDFDSYDNFWLSFFSAKGIPEFSKNSFNCLLPESKNMLGLNKISLPVGAVLTAEHLAHINSAWRLYAF